MTYREAMREAERKYLIEMLTRHHGNIVHTARAAGVSRSTIQRMRQEHGITNGQIPNAQMRCLWWPVDECGRMIFRDGRHQAR